MGVFTKLIDSIDHDDIRDTIDNNIDIGYRYSDDWSGEQYHANIYLNKLLSETVSGHNVSRNVLRKARCTLVVVDHEDDLDDWIADLHENYFPLLKKYWD